MGYSEKTCCQTHTVTVLAHRFVDAIKICGSRSRMEMMVQVLILLVNGNSKSKETCKRDFASLCSMLCFAGEQLPRISNVVIPTDTSLQVYISCQILPQAKRIQCVTEEGIWMEWGKGEESLLGVFYLAGPNTFHLSMLLMNCQKQPRSAVHSRGKVKSACKPPEDHKLVFYRHYDYKCIRLTNPISPIIE